MFGGEGKNTVEFRLANGTLDAKTWIENINLFGGIVKAAQELSTIQEKPESQRTEEETKKLGYFELIQNQEISDEEKVEGLLHLAVEKEDKDVYLARYKTNKELIKSTPTVDNAIKESTSKGKISINKVGKKVFTGENAVTGPEYDEMNSKIDRSLQREENDMSLE